MTRSEFVVMILLGSLFLGLVVSSIIQLRNHEQGIGCTRRMHTVVLALHSYAHTHRERFPPGTIRSPALSPDQRLSWYVALLPHLGRGDLHRLTSLTQPWNAGPNARFAEEILDDLLCINAPKSRAFTTFVGIGGITPLGPFLPESDPRAGVFGWDHGTSLRRIEDGTSHTAIVIETSMNLGPWAQGGPATLRPVVTELSPLIGPGRAFGGFHETGTRIILADGSIRIVTDGVSGEVLAALATPRGGEPIPEF